MKYLHAIGVALVLFAVYRLYQHDILGLFIAGIAAHQFFIHQRLVDFTESHYIDGED